MATENAEILEQLGRRYDAGFITDIESDSLPPGLDEDVVRALSAKKNEPEWMTECSQSESHCGIAHQCGARANWRLINDVVADALRGFTLAQMIAPPPSSSDDMRRRPIAVQVATR